MKNNRQTLPHFEACSLALIASWALVVAGAAYAQANPATEAANTDRDVAAAFREADKNGDGLINREEALVMPTVWAHFDQIDTNKDNNISLDELAKSVQK